MPILNKYRGSLIGLAVGDAMGMPVEFMPPGQFEPVTEYRGGGYFQLKSGYWTDDTSMALCLAESLIECNGFDAYHQMKKYKRWWSEEAYLSSIDEAFGLGRTVSRAFSNFEKTNNPFSGPTDEYSAGNGSIMRLTAVPLFYAKDPGLAIKKSAESSKTTHGVDKAIDACRLLGALIVGAINGTKKEELLDEHYNPVKSSYWKENPLVDEINEISLGSYKEKSPPDIIGTGYVVKTLEAVLWAFHHTDSFKEGLLKVVNLGDDADTTGAVYGQLAGAYYGEKTIPENWRVELRYYDMIGNYANKLYEKSGW